MFLGKMCFSLKEMFAIVLETTVNTNSRIHVTRVLLVVSIYKEIVSLIFSPKLQIVFIITLLALGFYIMPLVF